MTVTRGGQRGRRKVPLPTSSDPVTAEQRWTAERPCPICEGSKDAQPNTGNRCWGFMCSDGKHVVCTRVESATEAGGSGGWLHAVPDPSTVPDRPDVEPPRSTGGEEAVYQYEDESGTPLFEVVRFPGKQFKQRLAAIAGKSSLLIIEIPHLGAA